MNHEGDVRSVKFSSDDRYLISHSADATARVWDAPSGESICVLSHSHGVVSSAFVPQGRQVITTSLDGSARIWNFAEPRIALPLLSHSYPLVLHSAFSRDGQLLATSAGGRPFHFGPELPRGEPRLWTTVIAEPGVAHGEARLWDRNTGELLAPPLCHRGRVVHASFDPAGSRLATASYDHTGRIWDISPDWRPTADLFSLAQLVSAHQIDEFGGFVPATSAALRESWNSLRLKYPSSFTSSNAELAVWHRKEVMRSQQAADWRSAIRHSDQLIALRPQDPPLWAGRARAYAELDLWQDSLSDFRMAIDSGSDDEQIWCDYALATLASGDRAGYADICQRLLDQFADPIPAAAAARVMRACIVVPAAADLAALVKLADSTAKDPDNMFVLAATGAALFRAGRPDEAIGQISQAIEQSRGENVENWLFLAMAHHHAGQSQEAQRWFDRAVNWLDEPSGNLPSSATPWQDRLIRGLLRREAESMIHAKRGSQ
jgi:tetratricopeptide (TPR) repeat protein